MNYTNNRKIMQPIRVTNRSSIRKTNSEGSDKYLSKKYLEKRLELVTFQRGAKEFKRGSK